MHFSSDEGDIVGIYAFSREMSLSDFKYSLVDYLYDVSYEVNNEEERELTDDEKNALARQ